MRVNFGKILSLFSIFSCKMVKYVGNNTKSVITAKKEIKQLYLLHETF